MFRQQQAPVVDSATLPSWADAAASEDAGADAALAAKYAGEFAADARVNAKIVLYHGDMTRLRVDAVVNAANSGLYGGGGICGAIFAVSAGVLCYRPVCVLTFAMWALPVLLRRVG
jgi:hypothetical protein